MVGAVESFGAGRGSGTASAVRVAESCSEAAPGPHAATAKPAVNVTTNPRIRTNIFRHTYLLARKQI
jgi:hypothetical protein